MLLLKESVLSFEEQKHNLGLPTFKLPTSTNNRLRLTHQILFLTISVYDYSVIGPSSVVCIFHKGIISFVLCGYAVQMNISFERKRKNAEMYTIVNYGYIDNNIHDTCLCLKPYSWSLTSFELTLVHIGSHWFSWLSLVHIDSVGSLWFTLIQLALFGSHWFSCLSLVHINSVGSLWVMFADIGSV